MLIMDNIFLWFVIHTHKSVPLSSFPFPFLDYFLSINSLFFPYQLPIFHYFLTILHYFLHLRRERLNILIHLSLSLLRIEELQMLESPFQVTQEDTSSHLLWNPINREDLSSFEGRTREHRWEKKNLSFTKWKDCFHLMEIHLLPLCSQATQAYLKLLWRWFTSSTWRSNLIFNEIQSKKTKTKTKHDKERDWQFKLWMDSFMNLFKDVSIQINESRMMSRLQNNSIVLSQTSLMI